MSARLAETPEDDEPGEARWPPLAYAWYAAVVLSFGSLVSFMDRQVLALVVQDVKADLGLSDFHISLLQGPPFAVFYALAALPIAWAADRFNRRNIIIGGMLLWGVATAACGLAGSFARLFLARIGVGAGEASLGPSALSMIPDLFRPRHVAQAMAVFTMGNLAGVGTAMIAGGMLLAGLRALGPIAVLGRVLHPWQLTFVAAAAPSLILALLLFTIREPVRRGLATRTGDGSTREFFVFFGAHLPVLGPLFACFAALTVVAYANFSWTITFLIRRFALPAGAAAFEYGWVILIAGVSGAFLGGTAASWLHRRGVPHAPVWTTLAVTAPMAPLTIYIFQFAPSSPAALAALAVWHFFGGAPSGLAVTALAEITPNEMRARSAAGYSLCANIVGISLGATSVGYLTTHVFRDEQLIGRSLLSVELVGWALAMLTGVATLAGYRRLARR
jgi:MFS family permease